MPIELLHKAKSKRKARKVLCVCFSVCMCVCVFLSLSFYIYVYVWVCVCDGTRCAKKQNIFCVSEFVVLPKQIHLLKLKILQY